MDFFRGLFNALLIAVPFWGLIFFIGWCDENLPLRPNKRPV